MATPPQPAPQSAPPPAFAPLQPQLGSLTRQLCEAVRLGNLTKARELTARGADPFTTQPTRATLLHVACMQGHLATAQWLVLQCGLEDDAATKAGFTPLGTAAYADQPEIAEWLVETIQGRGVKVAADAVAMAGGGSALHAAAFNNSIKTATRLLELGATVDFKVCAGAASSGGVLRHPRPMRGPVPIPRPICPTAPNCRRLRTTRPRSSTRQSAARAAPRSVCPSRRHRPRPTRVPGPTPAPPGRRARA